MANFELFMGCLGNGLTVCNKAVEEHGDYKQIAHISPAGNIKWYIPVESVPGAALLRIEHTADTMYHNFKSALERDLSANKARAYYRMLNALSVAELLTFMNTTYGEPEDSKVEKLKALYLQRA